MSTLALRNYSLVLPSNYVSIEKDEMEYIDGGWKCFLNSTWFVAGAIDVAITVITAGIAINGIYAMKTFLRQNSKKLVKNVTPVIMKMFGSVAAAAVSGAIDIALTITATSIGGLIAEGLDRVDGHNNGYIFA